MKKVAAIAEKVDRLMAVGFIWEAQYPEWLSNIILVKKLSGKWRMCVDLIDLNKACPKDSLSIPRTDLIIDSIVGHCLLSFMDAYSTYNQI